LRDTVIAKAFCLTARAPQTFMPHSGANRLNPCSKPLLAETGTIGKIVFKRVD
jgi:hypothetical protein